MEALTEQEEGALFFVWNSLYDTMGVNELQSNTTGFYNSAMGARAIGYNNRELYSVDTYRSLLEKDYIKERKDKFLLTELGKSYIESILPQDLVVKIIALLYNIHWKIITELVAKVSLEGLPILLSYEDSRIRELARKRYEELNGRAN